MSDLGWRADGIERARIAGGIELELYRRPGVVRGLAVRRSDADGGGTGVSIEADPEPYEDDDE
jgi:hypothetical protein